MRGLKNTFSYFNQENNPEIKEIEGNCSIQTIELISISLVKTLTLGVLTISTLIGVILLYNFKRLRVLVFYSATNQLSEATHVYIIDQANRDDIEKIENVGQGKKQFCFKKLRYWINNEDDYYPVFFQKEQLTAEQLKQNQENGLSYMEVLAKKSTYGLNQHKVDTPNYFEYMVSVIFTPLYLLQYFVVIILSLQGLPLMGIILVVVSLITTSGNYIALYFSNKKIKQIAQKIHRVRVLRDNITIQIDSCELVPGDIFFVQNQMCCDAVLLTGQAYMNEHSLTGQTVPIAKFKIKQIGEQWKDNNLLFQGTINIDSSQNTKAMVIRTGFTTRKGKILRQILNRVSQQPDFFKKAVIFLIFSGILVVILFFATVSIKLKANIDRSLVWLSVVNFLLNAIPPAFPIYFTMAYSWSIYRLKQNDITTTMPQRTVQANRLRISCFDKTGTLTENNIQLENIYLYQKNLLPVQTYSKNNDTYNLMKILFGTCHTVRKYNEKLLGDEVDLRMYNYSRYSKMSKFQVDVYQDESSKFHYQILKIHQFESKHQSMSVLVHDKAMNKYYAFSKGAPQKMINFSQIKVPKYDEFVAQLALKGLRTIAFNYKQINKSQVQGYKSVPREKLMQNSKLLGLVTFQNQLKSDTNETIKKITEAGISCKMITGDGIYIAVQTAIRAGIVNISQKILVIQGKRQNPTQKKVKGVLLQKNQGGYIKQDFQIDIRQPSRIQPFNIAIDNDYLNSNPPYQIFLNANIFARVVPENKAKIIKLLKKNLIEAWQSRSLIKRIFGQGPQKISMAGDGANDLLAIRQADVGIGINDSDASYGAAFTIQKLGQTVDIIKQGKCTTQNIIQNLRYVLIVNFMNVTVDIICSTEATFLSMMMALFLNFFMITTLPIMSAYSKPNPQKSVSRHYAQDNFFGLQNHLLTWGNILILVSGLIGGYFYTINRPDYIANPKPFYILGQGYNPDCQLVSSMFLLMGIPLTTVAILIYKSQPWKNEIYKNVVFLIMLCINIAIMIFFYAGNNMIAGLFGTVKLPLISCLILFIISLSSQVLAFLYTYAVIRMLHPEYNEQRQEQSKKVQQITQTNIDVNFIP